MEVHVQTRQQLTLRPSLWGKSTEHKFTQEKNMAAFLPGHVCGDHPLTHVSVCLVYFAHLAGVIPRSEGPHIGGRVVFCYVTVQLMHVHQWSTSLSCCDCHLTPCKMDTTCLKGMLLMLTCVAVSVKIVCNHDPRITANPGNSGLDIPTRYSKYGNFWSMATVEVGPAECQRCRTI